MRARSRYGALNRLNPEAAGRCDRGGEIRKRSELIAEMRWAGDRLVPTGFLCCAQHIDPPHPQDRLVKLRPDPEPVRDPRPDIDVAAAAAAHEWMHLEEDQGEPVLQQGDDEEGIFIDL